MKKLGCIVLILMTALFVLSPVVSAEESSEPAPENEAQGTAASASGEAANVPQEDTDDRPQEETVSSEEEEGRETLSSEEEETLEKAAALDADQEDPLSYGIPVLRLNIDPEEYQKVIESEDHSYRAEGCTIRIDVPEGYESEYGETDPSLIGTDLLLEYFRGRGNSTWYGRKKPFKLKTDKKTDFFGMGKNKHWVLLANALDDTLLKNRVSCYMAQKLGLPYTPKCIPVEFYVNDDYIGSYTLGQDIRIDETRLDIDELEPSDTEEPAVTGGYLLALKPYYDDPAENKFTTSRGVEFGTENPVFEGEEASAPEQKAYISAYVQKTEDAIFGENFCDEEGISYAEYMDAEAAAKYWWLQEFCVNTDAYNTPSTYLYKERNGKLFWGPLWDFDLAFRKAYKKTVFNNSHEMIWICHLRQEDPEFVKLLKEIWENEYEPLLRSLTESGGVLDRYADELKASAMHDEQKQGRQVSYEDEVEALRSFIDERREEIRQNLDLLSNVYCTLTFMDKDTVIEKKEIMIGESLNDLAFLEAPEKEGFVFKGWQYDDGTIPAPTNRVEKDTVIHAVYITEEEAVKPDDLFFASNEIFVIPDAENMASVYYSVYPEEYDLLGLKFEVSDPDHVRIEEFDSNMVLFSVEGIDSFELTAVLYSGKTVTVTVHVLEEGTALPQITSVRPASEMLRILPGEYGQMKLITEPFPAECVIDSTSDDPQIAQMLLRNVVYGVSPGVTSVTVKDYYTELSASYTVIVAAPLSEDEISLPKTEYEYTGKEICPKAAVKYRGEVLREGEDYRLAYEDNIREGKASVLIEGIGKYCGTVTKYFRIVRPGKEESPDAGKAERIPAAAPQRVSVVNTEDTFPFRTEIARLLGSLLWIGISVWVLHRYS